jgi:hypothetical protein
MSEILPRRIDFLQAENERRLIEFLSVELDLAFTFLEHARIESGSNEESSKAVFERVRTALESIRRFQGRIEDRSEWAKIHDGADRLETALNEFSRESGPQVK